MQKLSQKQIKEIKAKIAKIDFIELEKWATKDDVGKSDKQKTARYAGYIKNVVGMLNDMKDILNRVETVGKTQKRIKTQILNVELFKDYVLSINARICVVNSLAHRIINPNIKQDSFKNQLIDHFTSHCPNEGLLITNDHDPNNL